MELEGRRAILVIADGYHDHEFWFPYYRLKEAGLEITVAGPRVGTVYGEGRHGTDGLPAEVTHTVEEVADAEHDLLYLPGGLFCPMRLRAHTPTLDLVRKSMSEGVLVAAICHAQWTLVSADVVRGRRLTCPRDMSVDVINAGGIYVEEPCVRDGNLITAVYFAYLPQQFQVLIPALQEV